MSVTRVKTKTGQIKWEVYVYTNGRSGKRLRRRFERRSDAETFLIEYQSRKNEIEKAGNGITDFEETTFAAEAEHWLRIQGPTFSPGHLKRAQGVLNELRSRIGHLSPIKLHAGALSVLRADFMSPDKNGKKPKPATVNRKLEVITSILNFSAKKRRLPSNPCIGFEKLKEVRDDIRFWERETAEHFLGFASRKYPLGTKQRWVYVVYLLAINSGVRAGEIWGLQPIDIQLGGEILLIRRQLDRVSGKFRPTKGKSNRRVPCNPELLQELQSLIGDQSVKPDEVVFRNKRGQPVCHDNFKKKTFDRDIKEWGGPRIRFHDLRHTAASLMVGDGLDLKTVQEICGHEDIQTTMNYAHLLAEKIKQAARSFSVSPSIQSVERKVPYLRVIK